jgi:hypothetical protein
MVCEDCSSKEIFYLLVDLNIWPVRIELNQIVDLDHMKLQSKMFLSRVISLKVIFL